MSNRASRILYCHCAFAKVVPPEVKVAVLNGLAEAEVEFEAVPDLCEMAAHGDERLREIVAGGPLEIAACYPRAVKWLFAAAGAQLTDDSRVWNMRVEPAGTVIAGLLAQTDRTESGVSVDADAVDAAAAGAEGDARNRALNGGAGVMIAAARRSRVVLRGAAAGESDGMSPADRATLTRLLLERGLEVSCSRPAAARPGHGPSGGTVMVEDFGEVTIPAPTSGVHVVNVADIANGHPGDSADLMKVAASIEADSVGPFPPVSQSARGHLPADVPAPLPSGARAPSGDAPPRAAAVARWKPWFPVIDYSRCTNCMQCLSFCLFDVYGVSADSKIQVQHQSNCKTDCPACSRVCPEVAIMFPKYRHGPINGEEVKADDVRREAMKVDISALLGGDVYAMLRDRSVKAKSRFSKERDDERALKERQNCLVALQRDLDVPAEVLAALPSPEEIMAKAEAARLRAAEALAKQPAGQAVNPRSTVTQS